MQTNFVLFLFFPYQGLRNKKEKKKKKKKKEINK